MKFNTNKLEGVIVTPIALALRKALRKDVQKVKKEEPNESVELSD